MASLVFRYTQSVSIDGFLESIPVPDVFRLNRTNTIVLYEPLIFVTPPSAGGDSVTPPTAVFGYDLPGVHPEPSLQQGTAVADRIRRGSAFWHEISDPHRDGVVLD